MYSSVLSATYSETLVGKRKHYHDGHQLLYIAEGSADVSVNGERESVTGGTLLLFSRFEEHSIAVKGGVYRRYSIRISPEILNSPENELLFSLLVNRARGFCRAIRAEEREGELEMLFARISREFSSNEFFREEMLDALLKELLIAICRMIPEEMLPMRNENTRLVYRLQKRLESGYHENLSLSDLAAECHVSVSHLSHIFKEITGGSVMEYLFACRMLAAKKYLATTDMPIGEIVSACGFSDDSNFSRSFKQRTGMTPRKFRDLYRADVPQSSP